MLRYTQRGACTLGLIIGLLWLVAPAEACGCGAYLPREGEASVSQERALIHWNGQTEDIVMELSVQGRSQEAAWILPVPSPATVKLGDADLFDTLHELTKPKIEYTFQPLFVPGMAGGAAPPPPVTVLERQMLGPFDVSTLAAQDANALSDWLATNGYNFPPRLANVLQHYVNNDWFYVAVKLSPGAAGQPLTGTLDPLWVTFDSDEMIYPMRPSALARSGLTVSLYILADHRVINPMSSSPEASSFSEVTFADWIDPATLGPTSSLTPFVERKQFLTKIVGQFENPGQAITGDYIFHFAGSDQTYRATETRNIYWGTFLCLGVIGLGLLLGLAQLLLPATRRLARRRRSRSASA